MCRYFKKLKQSYKKLNITKTSLRRRLTLYFISLTACALSLLLVLLNLSGVLIFSENEIKTEMEYQLSQSVESINDTVDTLAGYSISLSKTISARTIQFLTYNNLTLEELNNNEEMLFKLQSSVFDTINLSMRNAPCSGAFCLFNASVNTDNETSSYSGLYLKYANLNNKNTMNNNVCMFSGISKIARANNINLHSNWNLELDKGSFPEIDELFKTENNELTKAYILTSDYILPQTWEKAVFVCIPVFDSYNNVIAVCGFEVSNLYFAYTHNIHSLNDHHIILGLLKENSDNYSGLFSGNHSGFSAPISDNIVIKNEDPFDTFTCNDIEYIGLNSDISVNNEIHKVAVMMPENVYSNIISSSRIESILISFAIFIIMGIFCIILSKKYLNPIIKGFTDIKSSEKRHKKSGIYEIDDLFEYLSEKDKVYEKQINEHEQQIHQQELQLLEQEQQLHQTEIERNVAQQETLRVQQEIELLIKQKSIDIDENKYELFISNLKTLTPRESEVFALYCKGNSAKEICEILGLKQNGLKYHNSNIYSKLGVSSRKELLKYIAVMKQRDIEQ